MHIKTVTPNLYRHVGSLVLFCASLISLAGCPFAGPTAAFTATPTEGDAPLSVAFVDQSINGGSEITTWLWDFGDGSESSDQSPTHVYATNGFYRVSLKVDSNTGSSVETKDAFINVRAVPTAAFSASPRSGNTPLSVAFQDESTAAPFSLTAWRWTFGDGEVSEEQNPVHVYEQPGTYTVSLTVTSEGGSNTLTQPDFIVLAKLPTVSFEATPTRGPAPLAVSFTDTSAAGSAAITARTWVFGDGGTSTEQNPTYLFETPGIYSVSLTARTAAGEVTKTMTNIVTVTQAPTAAFSGSPTRGGAPLIVRFVDESTPGTATINDWLWDFGDGTSSVQQNPVHEYTEAGVFDVVFTVSTDDGTNTVTKKAFVEAQAGPTAAFSASVLQGSAPLTVVFSDESAAGASAITGRQWNFGDATVSGEENPVHTYTESGTYTVSLRVQSAVGPNIHTEPNYIVVVAPPKASFAASPTQGERPLNVTFTDTSVAGSSPITSYLWSFGDGTNSTDPNPARVYTTAGTYTVKLTVTTDDGTDSSTQVDFINVREKPVADFSANVTRGPAPLAVQFRDASTRGTETITSRTWDFGDGSTSTSEDPSHTYAAPGIYTVNLTLNTTSGPVSARKTGFIVVDPAVNFTTTADSGRAPAFVTFTDTSNIGSLTVSKRVWDFGDGLTSEAPAPVHQYVAPGTYDVSLTLSTEQGDAVRVRMGLINLRPTPAFTGEPRSHAGGPHAVQFEDQTDSGSLKINGWDWNFGDGGHSAAQNPSHTFAKPGLYAVSLTVLTDIGNSITTREGYVSIRPEAKFSADVTSGVDSLTVQFTDETDPGNLSVLSWLWTFGDGSESTSRNPSHTYTEPGTYTVSLTTRSNEGSDTETRTGLIKVAPLVKFTGNPLTGEAPLEVTFRDGTDPGKLKIAAWNWELGEGDPVMDETPVYSYAIPGIYDIKLTVTTAQGNATTTRLGYIKVLPPLSAMANITAGSGSASVAFTNTSDVSPLTVESWLWEFGDGTTSTAENPTHNYTTPGIFDVKLSVTTVEGVSATKSVASVSIDPVPAFTADGTLGVAPFAVQFTDTSNIGNLTVTGWAWDFGDTSTGTTQNPPHTFTTSGTYEVSLTITTALGNTPAASTTMINVLPAQDFSADVTSGPAVVDVVLTDYTAMGVTAVTSRTWDFGDGTSMTVAAPTATVSHRFTNTGSATLVRQVTLTQHTALGDATSGATEAITIYPISFSGDTTNQPHNLNVGFTDNTVEGDVTISSRDWDFMDGATATTAGNSTNNNYTEAGSYAVELTITTSQGNMATGTIGSPVLVEPVVLYAATSAVAGAAPLSIDFSDQTVLGNLSGVTRRWTWGDGNTDDIAGATTSHTYTTAGCYSATLELITDQGNYDDSSMAIDIVVEDAASLTPTTTADNNQAGIMFDLMANRDLRVYAFTMNFTGTSDTNTMRLYTAGVTSIGNESTPGVWTMVDDTVFSSGTGVMIDTGDVLMNSGDLFGFYLLNRTAGTTNNNISYQSGTGNVMFDGGDIELFTSAGKTVGGATDFDGTTFPERWFVGTVHYSYEIVCTSKRGELGVLSTPGTAPLAGMVSADDGLYPTVEDEIRAAFTPDGGRVAVGPYSATGNNSVGPFLIRTDHALSLLWERDLTGLAFDEIHDVRVARNGDLLLSGSTSLGGTAGETLITRMDSEGNLLWEQVLPGVPAASVHALCDAEEDGVQILALLPASDGTYTPSVYTLDRFSNFRWSVELPRTLTNEGWGIYPGADDVSMVYCGATDTQPIRYRLHGDGTIAYND